MLQVNTIYLARIEIRTEITAFLDGIIILTDTAKFTLHLLVTLGMQPVEQRGEAKQVLDAERRASGRHHDEVTGRVYVRPYRRQTIQLAVIVEEVHPVLTPAVPTDHEIELEPN